MRSSLPWDAPVSGEGVRLAELASDILARCRGEGPPNCVASCPLGVDVPGYLRLTRQGRFREALQKIRERLPFPGILGYICTHPCELHCQRLEQDAPVRIRQVKRFLAEWETGEPEHLLSREPRKGRRVAVVGSGPTGLMAAHDLRRRGFDVVLLESSEHLGGGLVATIPPWRLPSEVVERDLSIIPALGIEVRRGVRVGGEVGLHQLRREFDAVLFCGGISGAASLAEASGLDATEDGLLLVDAVTLECRFGGVFAAGTAVLGPVPVVEAMAHGRHAASMLAASLVPSSRRESGTLSQKTHLRWRLQVSEEERHRRAPSQDLRAPASPALGEAQALEEGERCLQCFCRTCVDECDFLSQACASPMELARALGGGVVDQVETVYSCTLCGLCAEVCPEKLSVGALMREARAVAVAQGLAPLKAHDGLLATFRDATRPGVTLFMGEPGRSKTRRLFFPGCSWPATSPGLVVATYDLLRNALPGLGVLLQCCGLPLLDLGMEQEAAKHQQELTRMVAGSGAEEVVSACPGCTAVLRERLRGVHTVTAWEVLARVWKPQNNREGAVVVVQDACRGRANEELHRAVRSLLEGCGARVQEPEFSGRTTRCCGRGGGVEWLDPALARRMGQRRVGEWSHPWVTACAGCRRTLGEVGAGAVHLMEFLLYDDWERRCWQPPPSGLTAMANRTRTRYLLKRRLPLGGEPSV